jgi:hypothetical protein
MLIKKGLGVVQEAIDDTKFDDLEATNKYNNCNGFIIRKNEYGPHVFLDTSLITDPNYKQETHIQSTLDSITKSITIDHKNYTLCGVINYISYDYKESGTLYSDNIYWNALV